MELAYRNYPRILSGETSFIYFKAGPYGIEAGLTLTVWLRLAAWELLSFLHLSSQGWEYTCAPSPAASSHTG